MAEEDNQPRNRKERHAAAKESGKYPSTATINAAGHIPLSQPDRTGPKGKTLLEIADERTSALQGMMASGQPFEKSLGDGLARDENGRVLLPAKDDDEEAVIGPVGESFFLATSLAMVHFTLDVLVFNQYAQEISWPAIIQRTAIAYPILFIIVYMMKSEMANRFQTLKQLFCLSVAIASGCYMIYAGNTYDYFAVMKQAPPLGALWIWSVIEMKLEYGLLSILIDVGFLFWNGYTVF
ncbi:hypothetical protein D6D20_02311 [Aureobasidium pullulans]|uniref:DUF7719 domain-containing protein n=1 Tax=Aureobasidium pullulans TaxID=5580 RepID=A0A4S8ZH26_AURPU|nr:hypothetical protein D6D20_02311 [Aureobasidium pullulans]